MRGLQAILLCSGAGLAPEHAGGDAHVAEEGAGTLVRHAAGVGLPAEAADDFLLCKSVPDAIGHALDGAFHGGLGAGIGQDLAFGNRLQQAQADHLGCDARAHHHVLGHGPVVQLGQAVVRFVQGIARAVGKAAVQRLGPDLHTPFGFHALDGRVVELVAVDRLGLHACMRIGRAGNRKPDQQGHGFVRFGADGALPVGRCTAPVHRVAAGARAGDEMRPQAIARGGRCRRLDPVALEKGVADDEAGVFRVREIGQRKGERLSPGGEHGALATGELALWVGANFSTQHQGGRTEQQQHHG